MKINKWVYRAMCPKMKDETCKGFKKSGLGYCYHALCGFIEHSCEHPEALKEGRPVEPAAGRLFLIGALKGAARKVMSHSTQPELVELAEDWDDLARELYNEIMNPKGEKEND